MKRPPTDLQILEEIYDRYYKKFSEYSSENSDRETKLYVPVDIASIAHHFEVDADIIHGRLYYHLEYKYGIVRENGVKVPFFLFVENTTPDKRHQVQFPILAAAIASLRDNRNQYLWATGLAGASFFIALLAFIFGLIY